MVSALTYVATFLLVNVFSLPAGFLPWNYTKKRLGMAGQAIIFVVPGFGMLCAVASLFVLYNNTLGVAESWPWYTLTNCVLLPLASLLANYIFVEKVM